jgi:hypothetical protein
MCGWGRLAAVFAFTFADDVNTVSCVFEVADGTGWTEWSSVSNHNIIPCFGDTCQSSRGDTSFVFLNCVKS